MTYQELWQRLTPLYEAGEAKAIARMVLENKFNMSLTDLYTGKVNELSPKDVTFLDDIFSRLEKGEPVQYVLGEAEFAGRMFHVEPGVLIPRPETAQLCELAEEALVKQFPDNSEAYQVLDVGTGSGCIAITIALNLKEHFRNAQITAWDISDDALRIARGNATLLGADVEFEKQDALNWQSKCHSLDGKKAQFESQKATLSMIVSNPPYIADFEAKDMEQNVLDFEPHLALFVPDDDPLRFYRAIAEYGKKSLRENGLLAYEINPLFVKEMNEMLSDLGYYDIQTIADEFGKNRFMICKNA